MDINIISDVKRTFYDYFGIILTEEQTKDFLKSNEFILSEIKKFDIDTSVREQLINNFTSLIGITRNWPTYGDAKEYKEKFYSDFKKSCKKANISLCERTWNKNESN